MMVAVDRATDFATIFHAHIARSIARCIAVVASLGDKLPAPSERAQALLTLSYAMKTEQTWPAARELLLVLAPAMERAGHRDDWTPYLEQGIEVSRRQGDVRAEAELRWFLGVILERRSLYDGARQQLAASADQFAALHDRRGQARALNRLAFVACLQRQLDEASRLAAVSAQLLTDEDSERGYCDFVWGHVALDTDNWQAAHDYFSQALARWQSGADRRMVAWGLTNLGIAKRRLDDNVGAAAAYEQAIALFNEVEDPVHEAVARMNLGNVYLMSDDPQRALEHYQAAEPVFQVVQGTLRLATVYLNIGMACRRLQRWSDAERILRASSDLYAQLNLPAAVSNVTDELGLTYQDQKLLDLAKAEFENALRWLPPDPIYEAQRQSIAEHLLKAHAVAAQRSGGGSEK